MNTSTRYRDGALSILDRTNSAASRRAAGEGWLRPPWLLASSAGRAELASGTESVPCDEVPAPLRQDQPVRIHFTGTRCPPLSV